MIIDGHAHIFPDRLAQRAANSIGDFYQMPMRYDGTAGTLLSLAERYGIDRQLVHSVATTPGQVASINDFIAHTVKQYPERLIGFATLHPDMEDAEGEVARVIGLGLLGIKLHPDFQRFYIDEKKMDRIYCAAEGRMPVLIHTGDHRYEYSAPERVVPVLERFPKLDMICAHFGGWSRWEEASRALAGRRVWVDTCSSMGLLPRETVLRLIEGFGEDSVIFGSDYPMWDPGDELELLRGLGLPETAMEKILYRNLCGLLKIDSP